MVYPKLVVFGLDNTLWKGSLDESRFGKGASAFPVTKDNLELDPQNSLTVRDRSDHSVSLELFPDVPGIIGQLHDNNVPIAIVSRNPHKDMSDRALYYVKAQDEKGSPAQSIIHCVKYDEVYNSSKTEHFGKIKGWSQLDYSNMLFFDGEPQEQDDHVDGLKVINLPDSEGLTRAKFDDAIEKWPI
ncbi:magnesium-dependent phosphatase-1 [Favolaschia claudopus]|uniref:Magnesium-dependent phosphatase-1 n=1 Tax=Favolaschia claudopus TaxID=2862362 RepID=A0AAW0DDI4_9AGAR